MENFTELLLRNKRSVSRICQLFFDEIDPEKTKDGSLPEAMVKKLITAGRMEKVEQIKILVWDLLLKQGDHLARLASPDDIAFALCVGAPLMRNRLIIFMVQHFSAEKVTQALFSYTSKTGMKLPSNVFRRFMELARAETQRKHRRDILSDIVEGSEFSYAEMDRLWSEYLSNQTRFELIRIFLSDSEELSWIKELKGGWEQLTFDFRYASGDSDTTAAFLSRVHAIRSRKQVSAQV